MENWKIIKDFPEYLISDKGRVKSLHIRPCNKNMHTIRVPNINNSGYYIVTLSRSKKKYTLLIHRLMASAFIPNPENKSDVNHKDGNKLNNSLDNLEWATHRQNSKHAARLGRWSRSIKQFDLKGNFIKDFNTIKDTGYSDPTHISAVCRGKRKSAFGYKWEYA